jgi:hypothetical protein
MKDPYADLLIFDWALALSSTVMASQLLGVPQSTVSRRMRAFQSDHRLNVRRHNGVLRVLSPIGYLDELRILAQRFRCLNSELRWASHPLWIELVNPIQNDLCYHLNMQVLHQADGAPGAETLQGWLDQRLLDSYLDAELCPKSSNPCWQVGIRHGDSPLPRAHGSAVICLGAFAELDGLEEAMRDQGWIVLPSQDRSHLPALTLIDHEDPFQGILPLNLYVKPQWRHAASFDMFDPLQSAGVRQFESRVAIALDWFHDAGPLQPTAEPPFDPLFSFAPLP